MVLNALSATGSLDSGGWVHSLGCHKLDFVQEAAEVPGSRETAPPSDPTVGLCLGPYDGPRGTGGFS